jgi:hypothetical protein
VEDSRDDAGLANRRAHRKSFPKSSNYKERKVLQEILAIFAILYFEPFRKPACLITRVRAPKESSAAFLCG